MTTLALDTVTVLHNRAPNRIRLLVPLIKNRATFAEMLKQSILKDPDAKGIYHAETNPTTATLLVKYHSGFHDEAEVLRIVTRIAGQIDKGDIVFSSKHKNPRLGRMQPSAFFTRELVVSIFGNVIAGLLLAVLLTR
jgi:hypothetical protein